MIRDAIAIVGLGSIGYGLWLVFPPLTYIYVGLVLFGAVALTIPSPPKEES